MKGEKTIKEGSKLCSSLLSHSQSLCVLEFHPDASAFLALKLWLPYLLLVVPVNLAV